MFSSLKYLYYNHTYALVTTVPIP